MHPAYHRYLPKANLQKIEELINERFVWLERPSLAESRAAVEQLSTLRTEHCDFSRDTVIIGNPADLPAGQRDTVEASLKMFIPWRKGPFSYFGIEIDAEWDSSRKWQRIAPFLPDLKGKVIADIGCNNGYYIFRMLHRQPQFVFGFDPVPRLKLVWDALVSPLPGIPANMDLLGVEHLHLFPESFDVIFLMGILYHHPSPLELLQHCHHALKQGGVLILETQGIPGELPVALFPEKRYAKVPGTYFVPTASCLQNLMLRAGFKDSFLFDTCLMTEDEQRQTPWMPYESYKDFIDKDNPSLTVEGYPAPMRFCCKGTRTLPVTPGRK